jgi:hypothetical protein
MADGEGAGSRNVSDVAAGGAGDAAGAGASGVTWATAAVARARSKQGGSKFLMIGGVEWRLPWQSEKRALEK